MKYSVLFLVVADIVVVVYVVIDAAVDVVVEVVFYVVVDAVNKRSGRQACCSLGFFFHTKHISQLSPVFRQTAQRRDDYHWPVPLLYHCTFTSIKLDPCFVYREHIFRKGWVLFCTN